MTQPMQEPDAPNDQAVIQTLLQELAQANDQRIYLKAQVAHLRAKLAEVSADSEEVAPPALDE